MEFLNSYMVWVVVGICLCVGYIIKYVIPCKALNQFIPLIVGSLGVLLNIWISGWTVSPDIILGGLASGLASTGMYELFRNFLEKFSEKEDQDEEDLH